MIGHLGSLEASKSGRGNGSARDGRDCAGWQHYQWSLVASLEMGDLAHVAKGPAEVGAFILDKVLDFPQRNVTFALEPNGDPVGVERHVVVGHDDEAGGAQRGEIVGDFGRVAGTDLRRQFVFDVGMMLGQGFEVEVMLVDNREIAIAFDVREP